MIHHNDNSEQTEIFGIDLFPVGHEEDEGYDKTMMEVQEKKQLKTMKLMIIILDLDRLICMT